MGRGGENVTEGRKAAAVLAVEKADAASMALLGKRPVEQLRKDATLLGVKAGSDGKADLLEALAPYAKGITHRWPAPKPLPLAPPPFGLTQVKKAIPAHCFERSLSKGLTHLAMDLIQIACLGYAATWINHESLPSYASWLLWPLYWFVQGTVFTGVWVLAHECGHQSFSASKTANDFVGLICHSALFVPYHSWRITHAKHHSNTGSCEHDEVFCPTTRSALAGEVLQEAPLTQAFFIVVMLTVGWMPGYLLLNATGPTKYNNKPRSHFNPWAVMFEERDVKDIIVSDIGFFAALAGLVYAFYALGFATVFCYYLVPYFICNGYLVLITYLQHTDVNMPHFRGKEWTWFRGALCTVDRSFGPLIDHAIHHIADTHVCHHVFSKMPFYHAQEATEAIKGVLGDYYMSDNTPIPKALWRSYTCCRCVEDDEDIVFYKSM